MSLVQSADLVNTLSGDGPFVVLAPTNAAFARLPSSLIQVLTNPANKQLLASILKYHVIPSGSVAGRDHDREQFPTAQGENVTLYFTGDRLLRTANYAGILSFEPVRCQNGMIFLIDNVLIPSGQGPVLPTPAPSPAPVNNVVQYLSSDKRFSTLGMSVFVDNLVEWSDCHSIILK